MTDRQVRNVLGEIYRIADAGAKGYATAAANMPDPGGKALLQSYAQQRVSFRAEILEALRKLDAGATPGSSIPGMIHRGRVAIFAGMAPDEAGQEKVVLNEVALGERAALRAYTRALAAPLPDDTRALLQRQLEVIRQAAEQVNLLRGQDGRRVLVGVYDAESQAAQAEHALRSAGFGAEVIEKIHPDALGLVPVSGGQSAVLHGATQLEAVLSGAFGGALWGGLTGILVGFGVVQTTGSSSGLPPVLAGVLGWLSFLLIGALIGGVLGLLIGRHLTEADRYESRIHPEHGRVLLRVVVDPPREAEAARILGLQGAAARG